MSDTRCRHCGFTIVQQEERALATGEVQVVWMAPLTGQWTCEDNDGDEHEPGVPAPGTHIVVEGNPVDGFVFHGIPAFQSQQAAIEWAENTCDGDWWIAPLQDVE